MVVIWSPTRTSIPVSVPLFYLGDGWTNFEEYRAAAGFEKLYVDANGRRRRYGS